MEGAEAFTFSGQVSEDGHVLPDQKNVVRGRLSRWSGRRVTVKVQRYVRSKTLGQLNTFHGPVLEAWCDYIGDDADNVKLWLKQAWGIWETKVNQITGEEKEVLKSLADYTVEELSAFLDRLIREGASRGIEFQLDRSSAGI